MQLDEFAGKTICCIICDSGERYLSVDGLFPADNVIRDSSRGHMSSVVAEISARQKSIDEQADLVALR